MSASQKPRKRYVPRPVDRDPVNLAIASAALVPPQRRAALVAPMVQALAAMRQGRGAWADWCHLADAMNVAERLADAGIANDHRATIMAAQAALAELHARHGERASWTLRGPEIAALCNGVEICEIQLELCTQGELAGAINKVQQCMHQALRGNASGKALVCVGALGDEGRTRPAHAQHAKHTHLASHRANETSPAEVNHGA